MIIKKFVAPTMTEALARVKNEMGDQAVILKTRMNRKTGGHSEQPDKGVEVTAAVETDQKKRFEISEPEARPAAAPISAPKREIVASKAPELRQESPSELLKQLATEISLLKETIMNRQNHKRPVTFFGNLSGEILEVGRQLIESGISEDLALELITKISQSEKAVNLTLAQIKKQIRDMLGNMIPAGEPITLRDSGPTVAMFVGPTGAGKTSAIARVGMLHKMDNAGQLAIVSADFPRRFQSTIKVVLSNIELSLCGRVFPRGINDGY